MVVVKQHSLSRNLPVMTHKQQIATRVEYEFVINEMEGEDIVENNFYDSLVELTNHLPLFDGDHIEIEVMRLEGSGAEGVTDREYAQVGKDGTLGEFDDGATMPNHVSKQFTPNRIAVLARRLSE